MGPCWEMAAPLVEEIRDSYGTWKMGFAWKLETRQILKMELQGIFAGLHIARHWNLKKIMVKTDLLEAWQQIIQNLNQAYDFTEGLEEIKALLEHDCENEFTTGSNEVVHLMARLVMMLREACAYLSSFLLSVMHP